MPPSTAVPVLSSTLLLTLLLVVGLVFFIRASTKDRTQTVEFMSAQPPDALETLLLSYFQQRAYRLASDTSAASPDSLKSDLSEPEDNAQPGAQPDDWLRLTGSVRPSVFLAGFLCVLAAVSLLCVALVLKLVLPVGEAAWGLVAIAPIAAIFYWRRAGREEQIAFRVVPKGNASVLTFRGHRDEIIQMAANLPAVVRQQ